MESGEGGATPGAQPVTPSDLDKDGSLNVRKRRAVEEVSGTEPTVKVRRKGNRAPEGTEQVCGELNVFCKQVKKTCFQFMRCYLKYTLQLCCICMDCVQKRRGLTQEVCTFPPVSQKRCAL